MEKTRVKRGEEYYFINNLFEVVSDYDYQSDIDNIRFDTDNYFSTEEEAESTAHKLRAVLKGADVIEMPSEEEFETMVQDSTHEITCGGHDRVYVADGQGKILDNITYEEVADIIRNTVDQLKSKIIK